MLEVLMVPLDGSELARCSLPLAAAVARRSGARLILARVLEPRPEERLERVEAGTPGETRSGGVAGGEAARRVEEELEISRGLVEEAGVGEVSTRVLRGPVVDALAAEADREDVDMVFMTTHGRSGLRRVLLGSVADELVRSTTLPTVLVHPACDIPFTADDRPLRHLLVPLDGSTVAEDVLPAVTELARALEARVTLTNVVSIESVFGPRPVKLLRHRSERRWARAYLAAVAKRLRAAGVAAEVHTTLGRAAAPTIGDVVDELDVDLIALATRGFTGVRRAVQGSVADQLLHNAQRPMLVVRGAEES